MKHGCPNHLRRAGSSRSISAILQMKEGMSFLRFIFNAGAVEAGGVGFPRNQSYRQL